MSKVLAGHNEDDPVPTAQRILGHVLKTVFTLSTQVRQDHPVLLENGEFEVQVTSFICMHLLLRKRVPVFSLPLLQIDFLSEDKRTSY